jgi:hypothetical protein
MQLGCVPNSNCTPINEYEGLCTCNPGYKNVASTACKPALGTPCDLQSSEPCAPERYLTCLLDFSTGDTGVCACGPDAILDWNLGQCLPRVGVSCQSPQHPCVPHAACTRVVYEKYKCQCSAGYSVTGDRLCRLGHYQRCDPWSGQLCNEYELLTCDRDERICTCSSNHLYNGTRCVASVFESCRPEQNVHCTENAICNLERICECAAGYASHENGRCYPGLGGPCRHSSDCSAGSHLICVEGTCSCNEEVAILDQELCLLKVGKPCDQLDICAHNAVCEDEVCQCANGLQETSEGLCRVGYLKSCNPFPGSDQCNSDAGLKCINQICSCNTGRVYASNIGRCVGLVGSECEVGSDGCTENADCTLLISRETTGSCKCKGGYEISRDSWTCSILNKWKDRNGISSSGALRPQLYLIVIVHSLLRCILKM